MVLWKLSLPLHGVPPPPSEGALGGGPQVQGEDCLHIEGVVGSGFMMVGSGFMMVNVATDNGYVRGLYLQGGCI